MQSQMIGMQSSLDRILSAVQQNQAASMGPPGMYGNGSREYKQLSYMHRELSYADIYSPPNTGDGSSSRPRFPPLPGFAPPVCTGCDVAKTKAYALACSRSLTSTPHMALYQALLHRQMTSQRTHYRGQL